MGLVRYPCGCEFKTVGRPDDEVLKHEDGEAVSLDIDIHSIHMDCPATWKIFQDGNTKGVFQLESYLGKHWSKKIHPNNIDDLAAIISLIRPGCIKVLTGNPPKSTTARYADRKNKLEDTTYYHPSLEPILNKTYALMLYQEQAMRIATDIAGFTPVEADSLRKSIGKKKADVMASLESTFIEGCKKRGLVNEDQAKEIFGWIRESQRYSFNRSHAVCYAIDSYWTAFCKAHFLKEFYCSCLEGARWKQNPQEELYELVNDAKINNCQISVPDFRHLESVSYVKGDVVYFSLGNIKGVGKASLDKLIRSVEEAKVKIGKPHTEWTWVDFLFYLAPLVSTTVVNALIMCGALDYLKTSRNKLSYEYNAWCKLSGKEQEWVQNNHIKTPYSTLTDALRACSPTKKNGGGCHGINRTAIVNSVVMTLDNPPHSLVDTPDFTSWNEEQFLGAPITCHKVDGCQEAFTANSTCKEVLDGKSGYTVLAVEVGKVRKLITKKGKSPGKHMAAISLSDASCSIDNAVAFPDVWAEYSSKLYEGNLLLIQGERDKKQGGFVIKKVWQI